MRDLSWLHIGRHRRWTKAWPPQKQCPDRQAHAPHSFHMNGLDWSCQGRGLRDNGEATSDA